MNIKSLIIIPIILLSAFISCQEGKIIESGTVSSQDYLLAEKIFEDIGRIVEDAFIDNGQNKSCPSYKLMNLDTSNIDTITLNFGDGNPDACLIDGKEMTGQIIITYTGKYRDSLSVIQTTFNAYTINGNTISGKRTMTNNGRENGNMHFSIEIDSGKIITRNGTINLESSKTKEWISGYNTIDNIQDDQYLINGSATGNSTNGQEFQIEITKDLYVDLGCFPAARNEDVCLITSGEINLFPEGYSTRKINYGDTICNCNVSVTLNGDKYPIVIH